ncbi:MAG: hypothetical protein ABI947_22035 [Chloroflexota bacterium]
MANTRRIPFVLNLDDPIDTAIWEVLEPMLDRRRASQFIRGAVAYTLGIDGLLPIGTASSALEAPPLRALVSGSMPRTKHTTRGIAAEIQPTERKDTEGTLDEAVDNFLNMFG